LFTCFTGDFVDYTNDCAFVFLLLYLNENILPISLGALNAFFKSTWVLPKLGMEQTETEHGTEREKIGLKHGNGIFVHGTIKKRNTDLFLTKTRKRNAPHGIIF